MVDADRAAGAEVADVLSSMGYAVEIARSGPEALSAVTRVPPVLIVVDQTLSGPMDAESLIARMRTLRDVRTATVLASGPDGYGVDVRLLDHGVSGYLGKPASRSRVEAALRGEASPAALPPFVPVISPPRDGFMSARRLGPRRSAPPPELPMDALRPDSGSGRLPSTGGMVAVAGLNEVDCWLEWGSARESCVLERANLERVIVRCPDATPTHGESVRLTVPLRAVIQDAMRDVPVRVLGDVIGSKPLAQGARIKIAVKAARPDGGYRKLRKYLASN